MAPLFTPILNGFSCNKVEAQQFDTHMHYHDAYELYYLLNGSRNYIMNNQIYKLLPDCVSLTKPDVLHGTSGNRYTRIVIYFTPHFFETYFSQNAINTLLECFSRDIISNYSIKKRPRIKELFQLILLEFSSQNMMSIALHLAELLMELKKAQEQEQPTDVQIPHEKISDILYYIGNNLSTVESLAQISKQFFISQGYLSRLFKQELGITFTEYLTNTRISKASKLLKTTNKTVEKISEECGFQTSTYFCITFKKRMKLTPLQYRSKSRNLPLN